MSQTTKNKLGKKMHETKGKAKERMARIADDRKREVEGRMERAQAQAVPE